MKDPWNFSEKKNGVLCENCKWPSPDGKYALKYTKVKEIINNYPLTGNCYLQMEKEEVLLHIDAGGPPVWSQNSDFFALPVWLYNESGYVQRLGFGSINDSTFKISTDFFKVMQLAKVDKDAIEIIENPAISEKRRNLKVKQLDFYETIHLFKPIRTP